MINPYVKICNLILTFGYIYAINDRLKKMGVKIKDRRPRDDITDEDIIKLKKEGKTQKEMSGILGCSHGYINKRLKKLLLN